MNFVRLTEKEKKDLLSCLDPIEKDSLFIAESILQKIAGIYISKAGYHPEMADMYRFAANSLSELSVH
ncbi:MAG: hypothetical protein IKX61_07545 [Prevotella sp.]|nr:hypothetical protein [Prevotella sp.]